MRGLRILRAGVPGGGTDSWYPAIDSDGDIRGGAWVAEATGLVEMNSWPTGTRLILRKEAVPASAR